MFNEDMYDISISNGIEMIESVTCIDYKECLQTALNLNAKSDDDLYFNARTNIERSVENERLFNAGFRLAYNSKRTYNETDKEA